jgi:hypothetical protein|tara:strand:- start:2244 stop:2843 length:600 start_codon:yes stop_codon:yes gene_type:complete
MKKAMTFVVMAVAVLSTSVNYASINGLNVQEHFSIQDGKITNVNPKLVIRNKKGIAIFEGTVFNSSSMEELVSDMDLSNGSYTYEVIGDTNVEITSFVVEETTILFDAKGAKTIFMPTLRVKDDLVLVSQLSLLKEPLKIKMYYSSEEDNSKIFDLIHTDKIGEEMILDRVYSLDKNKTGDYKIKFISNGKVFTETFTL